MLTCIIMPEVTIGEIPSSIKVPAQDTQREGAVSEQTHCHKHGYRYTHVVPSWQLLKIHWTLDIAKTFCTDFSLYYQCSGICCISAFQESCCWYCLEWRTMETWVHPAHIPSLPNPQLQLYSPIINMYRRKSKVRNISELLSFTRMVIINVLPRDAHLCWKQ